MNDLDEAKKIIKGLLKAIDTAEDRGCLDYTENLDKAVWGNPLLAAKRFVGIPTPWEDKEEEEARQEAARKAAKAAKAKRDEDTLAREYGRVK